LQVIQLSQDKWVRGLEKAIMMGATLMIENCPDDLDATLEPVLTKAIYKRGKNEYFIKIVGEEKEYDMNFKLFLQTKLTNPHYRPETAAQCTIINFIVTESGLEDQLLAMVVNREKPELEEKRSALVSKQNEYKIILSELEDELLKALSGADPETILDNIELVEQLESTKVTAKEIAKQTIEAQKTEIVINKSREG
jgi:dynein heavy chain